MITYQSVVVIPREVFNEYEPYLHDGLEIEGFDLDGVAETFTAKFPDGFIMDIKICNAPTDGGGAYVDPVLFKFANGGYNEVMCGDVGNTLDNVYILEYNDVEYQAICAIG